MEYEIEFLPKAEEDFHRLPVFLRGALEAQLVALAKSPQTMSQRTPSPPYPPGGMVSEFDYGPIGNTEYHISIFYVFSQDEMSLLVFAIGYYPMRIG